MITTYEMVKRKKEKLAQTLFQTITSKALNNISEYKLNRIVTFKISHD